MDILEIVETESADAIARNLFFRLAALEPSARADFIRDELAQRFAEMAESGV